MKHVRLIFAGALLFATAAKADEDFRVKKPKSLFTAKSYKGDHLGSPKKKSYHRPTHAISLIDGKVYGKHLGTLAKDKPYSHQDHNGHNHSHGHDSDRPDAGVDVIYIDGKAYPICSSEAVDPDGDKWGWENNTSCVVVD